MKGPALKGEALRKLQVVIGTCNLTPVTAHATSILRTMTLSGTTLLITLVICCIIQPRPRSEKNTHTHTEQCSTWRVRALDLKEKQNFTGIKKLTVSAPESSEQFIDLRKDLRQDLVRDLLQLAQSL